MSSADPRSPSPPGNKKRADSSKDKKTKPRSVPPLQNTAGRESLDLGALQRAALLSTNPSSPRYSAPLPSVSSSSPPIPLSPKSSSNPANPILPASTGPNVDQDQSPLSNASFGTASDFIMRTLIMEFREHTKKKIDDILKFGVVREF